MNPQAASPNQPALPFDQAFEGLTQPAVEQPLDAVLEDISLAIPQEARLAFAAAYVRAGKKPGEALAEAGGQPEGERRTRSLNIVDKVAAAGLHNEIARRRAARSYRQRK